MLGVNEHMDTKLFGREIIFEEFQRIWTRTWSLRTDRRTVRRIDENNLITAPSALASRAKNLVDDDDDERCY